MKPSHDLLPGVIPGREPTIWVDHISKWYGDIVAVSDVTFGVSQGVTALLGPNGAGKSTTLKMMAGLLSTSSGQISILGSPPRGRTSIYRKIGLVHESEHIYPYLTGREFVRFNAILQRVKHVDEATDRAIAIVEMAAPADRTVGPLPVAGLSLGPAPDALESGARS